MQLNLAFRTLDRLEAPQDELIGNAFIKLSEIVDPEMELGKAGPPQRRYFCTVPVASSPLVN